MSELGPNIIDDAAKALATNLKKQADSLGFISSDEGRYPVLDGCFDMREAAQAVLSGIDKNRPTP